MVGRQAAGSLVERTRLSQSGAEWSHQLTSDRYCSGTVRSTTAERARRATIRLDWAGDAQ